MAHHPLSALERCFLRSPLRPSELCSFRSWARTDNRPLLPNVHPGSSDPLLQELIYVLSMFSIAETRCKSMHWPTGPPG